MNNSTQTVGLVGTGSDGLVSLSIAPQTFGNQQVGTPGGPATVSLANLGNGPLTINSVVKGGANPGDFAVTNNCPLSLASYTLTQTPISGFTGTVTTGCSVTPALSKTTTPISVVVTTPNTMFISASAKSSSNGYFHAELLRDVHRHCARRRIAVASCGIGEVNCKITGARLSILCSVRGLGLVGYGPKPCHIPSRNRRRAGYSLATVESVLGR